MNNAVELFNSFIEDGRLVNDERFDGFFSDLVDGEKYSDQEKLLIARQIERVFFDVDLPSRSELLFFLSKLDVLAAHRLADAELKEAYDRLRMSASYLYQIIICKDNVEFFLGKSGGDSGIYAGGLSVIEMDKSMKIAFHLLRQREIAGQQ